MFVRRWMSSPAVTIPKEVPAASALEFMRRRKVRRLPVTDGGRLVGIVTQSDLQASRRDAEYVEDRMTRNPLTVAPEDTLEQAARLMLEKKVSGLPVVEKEALAGIITESDVFRALCEMLGVGEKGARVVFSVPEGDDLLAALRRKLSGLVPRSLATLHDAEKGRWEVVMRVRGRVPLKALAYRI
jgi:acetoin utilization protein AcuB